MKNGVIIAGVFVTLSLGFFAGRMTSSSSSLQSDDSPRDSTIEGKRRAGERSTADRPVTRGARLRQEIRSVSTDRIPDLVFRALENGDPILRQQLMSELYSRMDAGNYRRMMEEILHVSDATGREYPEEYLLMAMRAGQIAGQEAMEGWKAKGIETDAASKTLTGWAHVDPEAARRYGKRSRECHPPLRLPFR